MSSVIFLTITCILRNTPLYCLITGSCAVGKLHLVLLACFCNSYVVLSNSNGADVLETKVTVDFNFIAYGDTIIVPIYEKKVIN